LRTEGGYRQLRRVEGRPAPRMLVDGRDCLMMASSNYLDLAGDPRVLAAASEAADAFGTAAAGSRLINGNLALHETLEAELATFVGLETALVFSSGYLANLGTLTALAGPDDVIVSDELNHASIIDGCRLSGAKTRVFRHNDPDHLTEVLRQESSCRRRLLVLDGVFSMDGDTARLADLVPIAREHDALVILDDAHGIGILGPNGRGTAEAEDVGVDVLVGNLGKALGSFGAFVACNALLRDCLINTARSFIFTCALAPPALGAAREALRIIQREPFRARALLERADQLRVGLKQAGYDAGASTAHIVPAIVGDSETAMDLSAAAFERGIFAHGIRYPTVPRGSARIRFTPSAGHTADEIATVVDVFAACRPAGG
jgi:8-amino-7-oxononanoate synthase